MTIFSQMRVDKFDKQGDEIRQKQSVWLLPDGGVVGSFRG